MGFTDWQFDCEPPAEIDDGWWFEVRGTQTWRWGPYPSQAEALSAELVVFQRWNRAARDRGGWAWKATPRRWVVTAPADVPVSGLPLERSPCTRHDADG